MSAIEPMDRVAEIVEGAVVRKHMAQHVFDTIAHVLDTLRETPRTASMQHYLLGVQRAMKEEQAAAMHILADTAALHPETKGSAQ